MLAILFALSLTVMTSKPHNIGYWKSKSELIAYSINLVCSLVLVEITNKLMVNFNGFNGLMPYSLV